MPQWKDVDVNFRGSSSALGDAMQQIAAAASIPGQMLKDREAQKRYEAELARQKVLDDRATTLFEQQQADRAQQLKDRENRVLFEGLKGELLPHLQAQDGRPTEFDGVLSAVQQIPVSGGQNGGQSAVAPTITQTYAYDKRVPLALPNESIDYKVAKNTKVLNEYKEAPTVFGIPQSVAKPKIEALDKREDALLSTPGMYRTLPASSVRELTPAGQKALAQIEAERKEVLRDKSVPKYKTVTKLEDRQTTFNDLDLSRALTKTGAPAEANAKVEEMFVRDTKSNNLVPLSKAMASGSRIGQAPTEKIETAIGTRTVKGPTLGRIMTDAKQYGMNPEAVKQSYAKIDDGYKQVLAMLPKDNSARREEMRGYLTMIASNLGLDPKDVDISKEVDSILPKAEMSEAQKFAANTVIHALDEKKKEIMDNKKLALQEKEMLLQNEYRKASLGLQQAELSLKREAGKAAKIPEGYILDPRYAPEGYVSKDAYLQNLKKAARTPEEIRKEQLEIKKLEKELTPGFSLFSPSTW